MRGIGAILATATLWLSGCLGILDSDVKDTLEIPPRISVEDLALPFLEQDHEHHRTPAAHAATIGLDVEAFVPGRLGAYPKDETYTEMAVKAGYAFVTFQSKGSSAIPTNNLHVNEEAGFLIYDVRDPASPRLVGRWVGQPSSDLEVSDDGNWVMFSTQRNGYPYAWTLNPVGAPVVNHAPRGTYFVDVQDKTRPTTAGFAPLPPNGPHTITYYRMPDGRELLLQCTYDILFTNYPENYGQLKVTQKVVISEIVPAGAGRALRPLSVFQVLTPDQPGGSPDKWDRMHFPHDATVHLDPVSQRVFMDVAYWDSGLVVVDITDPARPAEVGRFADTGPSQYTRTHLARVFPGTIDGRVVAVLEPEISAGTDAGQYTFVDITDPARPEKLGQWALPGDHIIDKPFVFSPHNFDLACGGNGQVTGRPIDYSAPCQDPTVVLGQFHGGLWTLDASDPTQPRATGFFFPLVQRADVGPGFPFTGFFGAYMVDGFVYAPETWTGLYVMRPGAIPPAPS